MNIYFNMLEDTVHVCEDGTSNGHVMHRMLLKSMPSEYTLTLRAQGVCHPKHADSYRLLSVPSGFHVAGQDVYGHTEKSIVVCDGHGPNGIDMAIQAVSMASVVEESVCGPITNPYIVEAALRDVVRTSLISAPDTHSGATYVQMLLHQWEHRRWVITVNVGDSEALLVDSNTVLQCSVAHNWDNYDVYRRYVSTATGPPHNVCYNRWNASSKYKTSGPDGLYEPILLYDALYRPDMVAAAFVQQKMGRRNYPYGTQSVRMPTHAYENWGSCVCIDNKALGQLMACYGDKDEREKTGVPYDMVHIYIHELSADDDVCAIVQSDGVSNSMTLQQCGMQSCVPHYLPNSSKDDMSVVRAHWYPNRKTPCLKR
jgi:hypothetical protein